jgi:hypothetical protein
LVLAEVKEVVVIGVKIPELRFSVTFKTHQDCPMACDAQHYSKDKGLFALVLLEGLYFCIELVFGLFRKQQVFVLEFPRKVHVSERLVIFSENIKVVEHFNAYFIVSPFKVTPQNVLLFPRPLVLKLIGLLDFKEELFDFLFEFPERRCTVNDILTFEIEVHVKTTQGIEGGVVAAEIWGVLFVALSLEDVEVGVKMMGDEFLEWAGAMCKGFFGEVVEYGVEEVVEDVAYFLGDDGDLDLRHD